MANLTIKSAADCLWDEVSLGEVMLRLDPGEGRVRTARAFQAWEGGGEYNVARGLRRCFGLRTAITTAFADNDVGRLLEDLILQGGVDTRHIKWAPCDGLGRRVRNGINFTERGFGVRGARGASDRGHTAASQLKAGDFDWDLVFGREGARWFHCGGIFAALSATTSELVIQAIQAARRHGTIVSYDLNYRASLWEEHGGMARAREVNRRIAGMVDVMIGNEEDFTAALGYEVQGGDAGYRALDSAGYEAMIDKVIADYPSLKIVATTLRAVHTASVNDWGAVLYANGAFHHAVPRLGLAVFDRVGGGDSFASGLIYAALAGMRPAEMVEYGAAHGALAMTTPGDNSMATRSEVEKLVNGDSPRITR
jgi:2-dehydro-3-deoxygluconokinase